jgi:hypothetical protein
MDLRMDMDSLMPVRVMIMNIKKGHESERCDEVVPANEQPSILDVLNFELRARPVAR